MFFLSSTFSRLPLRSLAPKSLLSNISSRSAALTFKANMVTINTPRDPNTLSNYNNWLTTHTTTSFELLFAEGKLAGTVVHKLKSITDAETKEIILDTNHLLIKDVKVNDSKVEWELLKPFNPYGRALKITLDKGVAKDKVVDVWVDLETTAATTALQWMDPAQTSNKKYPYMFSQCQAIFARSIFPCQDTPDVKATYDFYIKSPLPVIASGLGDKSNPTSPSSTGKSELYKFHQAIPIPSYLYALASGDIVSAPIGKHSLVATGPDELKGCQWELEADMDKFISAAEGIVYPYAWGQYNVLILPPSFPYGGMENPVYTFATPTIISGDRQNVDVIAHELSHAWSGNLVSCASWEHFWLNEGWTTYLERRIQAVIHGDDAHRDFSAIIGWKALADSIEQFGDTHNFTKLIPDLKGQDPDEAFSSVPYEKGFVFLYYIEKLIGIENFDKFIPHYFTVWREKSVDSYEFKTTLLDFFADNKDVAAKLATIDWDAQFYTPGFPTYPNYDTSLADVCYDLADKWQTLTASKFTPQSSDIAGWSSNQIVVFLEKILTFTTPLTAENAHLLGQLYKLVDTQNVEISSRYYQIAMAAGDQSIKPKVSDLLGRVGRMKFVRPLYRGLIKIDLALAVETFEKYKDFYHPICRAMVVRMVFGKEGTAKA